MSFLGETFSFSLLATDCAGFASLMLCKAYWIELWSKDSYSLLWKLFKLRMFGV